MEFTATRAGVIGTVVVLIVAGVCVRLGLWQLDRLEQRRTHNAGVEARLQAPPLELGGPLADTAGLLYRRVVVEGELDHERSVVLRGRVRAGTPGVHLVTPLRRGDDAPAVIVVRGWLPAPDAATVDPSPYAVPGRVTIAGIALPFPLETPAADAPGAADAPRTAGAPAHVWRRLDAGAFRRRVAYRIEDLYVQVVPGPTVARELPAPLSPPALDDGPHLSYAVQWFSFAAVALLGWGVLVARRGGRRRRPMPTP